MDDTTRGVLRRWPVFAQWLGVAAEAVLTSDRLILRDRATGAVATLDLADIVAIDDGRTGVRLRVRRGCWIDFAGVMFDGWYEVGCRDQAARTTLVAALAQAVANPGGGPRVATPFLTRLRRPWLLLS
jgi:hypothetical protein